MEFANIIDLTPYFVLFITLFCIMSITVFSALLGWGLEILHRRHATLLLLFGMCTACLFFGLFLFRMPIQKGVQSINRMGPIPTLQATAVPLPTEQLSRGSRE